MALAVLYETGFGLAEIVTTGASGESQYDPILVYPPQGS